MFQTGWRGPLLPGWHLPQGTRNSVLFKSCALGDPHALLGLSESCYLLMWQCTKSHHQDLMKNNRKNMDFRSIFRSDARRQTVRRGNEGTLMFVRILLWVTPCPWLRIGMKALTQAHASSPHPPVWSTPTLLLSLPATLTAHSLMPWGPHTCSSFYLDALHSFLPESPSALASKPSFLSEALPELLMCSDAQDLWVYGARASGSWPGGLDDVCLHSLCAPATVW